MRITAPLSSVGWTVSNAASKIIDPETGDEIDVPAEGLSETGELWFKGPNVMAGYLGNEEATRETIDDDGWLHTGDLAQVDANGCVYIVDRLKELIKYKGYQVPPAELEAVLLSHPAIADAAVIGVVDAEGEEVPKAFVVKQSEAELTEDEVMEFVAGQVAPYKKVRQVEFIEAIPKSASGKILRKDLRTSKSLTRSAACAARACRYPRAAPAAGISSRPATPHSGSDQSASGATPICVSTGRRRVDPVGPRQRAQRGRRQRRRRSGRRLRCRGLPLRFGWR